MLRNRGTGDVVALRQPVDRLLAAGQVEAYRPAPYPGSATFVRADVRDPHQCYPLPLWTEVVGEGLTVEHVPGDHTGMMADPNVQVLADRVQLHLSH